jgi:hypothetical protein
MMERPLDAMLDRVMDGNLARKGRLSLMNSNPATGLSVTRKGVSFHA